MLSNLLIYRFLIVNTLIIVAGVVAWSQGLVTDLLLADSTGLIYGIIGLFTLAFIFTTGRVFWISQGLNLLKESKDGAPFRFYIFVEGGVRRSKEKYMAKYQWLHDTSGWLASLGLIGTVIGFAIALSGIDQTALAQASGVKASVTVLMDGMRVALSTTIAGAILGMWNEINQRILQTGITCFWNDLETYEKD